MSFTGVPAKAAHTMAMDKKMRVGFSWTMCIIPPASDVFI
jgi:hypothetical protein